MIVESDFQFVLFSCLFSLVICIIIILLLLSLLLLITAVTITFFRSDFA